MDGLERDFGSMVQVERFVYGLGKREKGRNMTSGSPVFYLSIFMTMPLSYTVRKDRVWGVQRREADELLLSLSQ